jgi:methionine-rich copper-binding protein CopC
MIQPFLLSTLLLYATAAQAHSFLKRSDPPAAGVLAARPEKDLRLEFTQAIEPTLIRVRVVRNELELPKAGPATLSLDARTVIVGVAPFEEGSYDVEWSVVSRDAHRTSGSIKFRVKAPE